MTHFYATCKAQLTGLYVKHDSTVEIKTKNDSTWIRRPFSCRETVIWKLQAYCTAYNDGYFSSGSWQFCSSVIVKKSNMQQWRHEVIRWRHMTYDIICHHMMSYVFEFALPKVVSNWIKVWSLSLCGQLADESRANSHQIEVK